MQVWTPASHSLPVDSPIRSRWEGAVWGVEMFEVLYKSRIRLNHHMDVADAYAGNVRLFEATGVGSLLITDWKKNLHERFEPGKEIVAYKTPEECLDLIQYYAEHNDERKTIAKAGQGRTLRDHTYYNLAQ